MAVKDPQKDLVALKSQIVDTLRKAEGVLSEPPPEALVVGLRDPGSDIIKIRVSWWTRRRV